MCGTIYGHIYYKNGQLLSISSGWFDNAEIYFYPKLDGSYSTRLYSMKNHIDKIFYYSSLSEGYFVNITPIDISMETDSVVLIDIHLLDTIYEDIQHPKDYNNKVIKIFPNLINSNMNLHYEISLPVKSTNCFIDLINMQGQTLTRYKIPDNSNIINLPAGIANGTYVLQLILNGKAYDSSRITVVR